MEESLIEDGENSREGEIAPALIAIHPLDKSVVVAVGPELRVFDIEGNCPISLSDDSGGPSHSDVIRAISFGANGSLFASAGDDKLVKIWRTDSWHCTKTVCAEKRVSAVAISHNGQYVVFADKFGLVWIIALGEDDERQAPVDNKAVPILGHYCSIITDLKFSPDGQFIASADQDFKIRITAFPKRPLKGAHEIQSFCLGHTDFVSCLAFACPLDYPQGILLSGGGDSTVRLWNFISGRLLDTCDFGAQAGLVKSNGTEKECCSAVIDICASCDGSIIAVAIQSLHGIVLLNCDFSARTLSIAKVHISLHWLFAPIHQIAPWLVACLTGSGYHLLNETFQVVTMEKSYVPTGLELSCSSKRLWMVMGVSNIHTLGTTKLLAYVRVMSGFQKDASDRPVHNPVIMGDTEVPGGEKLLEKLQGALEVAKEKATLAATAAAVQTSMHNLFIKKQYSVEKRELRKRSRNDRKLKQ